MPIVRLKPYDPRRGHRLRQLIDSSREGKRYVEGHLYSVPADDAEHLSWFMQDTERVNPAVSVQGRARAFDVFTSADEARSVIEEENRGQLLQPSARQVFSPPGRDAAEEAVPTDLEQDTLVDALDAGGVARTFRGPTTTRTVQEGRAPRAPSDAQTTRGVREPAPPTARERRDKKIADAAAAKRSAAK